MSLIEITAPLDGWLVPIVEVPDPVFAGRLAGDGVAIEPVSDTLHAPCDGTVRLMRGGRHALTLVTVAGDLLLHVGIDTVALRGEGFELLVADGAPVRAGEPLLRFDLDLVARRAPSLVTPVLLTGTAATSISRRRAPGRVRVGDVLFVAPRLVSDPLAETEAVGTVIVQTFQVPFEHGLHARPAARIAAALAGITAVVELRAQGRASSARSVIGLMTLGVVRGDPIEVVARGPEAQAAVAALAKLLGPVGSKSSAPAAAVAAAPADGSAVACVVASRGVAMGNAQRWSIAAAPVSAGSGDPGIESGSLGHALELLGSHLQAKAEMATGARRGVLDAHRVLLGDPELRADAERRIAAGAAAGLAWREALSAAADALARTGDERMAERRADLFDLEQQLLRVLAGQPPDRTVVLAQNAILIADELLPSQLLSLDPDRLVGICTAAGGATSHVAILAGSLGIPMLVAAGYGVLAIAEGAKLILDADVGILQVVPSAAEVARYERIIALRASEAADDARRATEPACLADGTSVRIDCNLGALDEAAAAIAAGAEGCGLLRTEFLFLNRDTAPTEDEQFAVYVAIGQALAGRPLTIRTLDAGGDKPIPFLPMVAEQNPALGMRGLRAGLWRMDLLETQLRAILRAAVATPCRLLLPMVTDVADIAAVRQCLARLVAGTDLLVPPLGIMIETPASAQLADQLAPLVDFFSIGSNDLSQYVLAIDRLHPVLAARLDGLHPAVLRTIATAASAAAAHGTELCVCGGLASDPDAVPLLVGLGVRELSVLPSMIGRIKNVVRGYHLDTCKQLARDALARGSAADVRALVKHAVDAGRVTVRE